MPLPKCLLIDSDLAHHRGLPPLQSPPYRPLHDPVNLLPAQLQSLRHRLLTGRPQPFNRQPLKQRREAAVRLGPRHRHHPHAVLLTLRPRWLGVQYRSVLARVQVPPRSLRLVVVQPAQRPAFRTRPLLPLVVLQVDVNLSLLQPQFHLVYEPRLPNPQNLFIKLSILHGSLFCHAPTKPPSSLRKETTPPQRPAAPTHSKARIPGSEGKGWKISCSRSFEERLLWQLRRDEDISTLIY